MQNIHNTHSRIHKLNGFPSHNVCCYVKRDDELSCGISGTKYRKYTSIIPYLIANNIKHLLIIAGAQSNNLLAALQVARELQLKVTAFLLKPKSDTVQGNFKLSRLFLQKNEIIWLERSHWSSVNLQAENYLDTLGEKGLVLSEGASIAEALPGAMSLADDILCNEKQTGIQFSSIFIDAGTGFAASALLHRMTQLNHLADIYVLLLADSEEQFNDKLVYWLGYRPQNYSLIRPHTARSFGAVNGAVKQEIKRMAIEEGILVDPVYSAKLFHEARRVITTQKITGNVLIIHSGGVLTLPGFDWSFD